MFLMCSDLLFILPYMYLLSKCCHGVFYVFSSTLNKIIYTFILFHWNCVTCQQTHTMNMKMAICFTSSHKKQGVRLDRRFEKVSPASCMAPVMNNNDKNILFILKLNLLVRIKFLNFLYINKN